MRERWGRRSAFFDVVTKLPLGNARQVRELKDLLAQSDIVSLHVPETQATQWMIGAAEIAAMKPGAILINASRGTVVEIDALAEAKGRSCSARPLMCSPSNRGATRTSSSRLCGAWTT